MNFCPKVEEVKEFELERYMGTWYQLGMNSATHNFQNGGCVTSKFELRDDGKTIDVYNSGQKFDKDGSGALEKKEFFKAWDL